MPRPNRSLATLTALALAVFPSIVVLLNLVQAGHYSARSQAMSELALGRGGGLMFVAFTLMGTGTLMLAVLLHRELPRARVTPAALAVAAALDVLSAIFHTNAEHTPATTASNIHQLAGIATYVLVVIAMFSMIRHFRRSPQWASFAASSLVWSVLAFAAFFLVPLLGDSSFGLAQRVFVAAWLSWMITTALVARHNASRTPQLDQTVAMN